MENDRIEPALVEELESVISDYLAWREEFVSSFEKESSLSKVENSKTGWSPRWKNMAESFLESPSTKARVIRNVERLRKKAASADKNKPPLSDEFSDAEFARLEKEDPLFHNPRGRWVFRPPTYPEVSVLYKKAQAAVWVAEEIDMTKDIAMWETMDEGRKNFIKNILAFFVVSDGVIAENVELNFRKLTPYPEIRGFYGQQVAIEDVHAETYGRIAMDLFTPAEFEEAVNSVNVEGSGIKEKNDFVMKWMDADCTFAERVVAFACAEGISFSSSFIGSFWMEAQGLMPGLAQAISLISRDEGMHRDNATILYRILALKLSDEMVRYIIKESVEAEIIFVERCLRVDLVGMNKREMIQYVKYCADLLYAGLVGGGYIYGAKNPFEFAYVSSAEGKSNFFEIKVTEYQKSFATFRERLKNLESNVSRDAGRTSPEAALNRSNASLSSSKETISPDKESAPSLNSSNSFVFSDDF